jgi:hypothetical protein
MELFDEIVFACFFEQFQVLFEHLEACSKVGPNVVSVALRVVNVGFLSAEEFTFPFG